MRRAHASFHATPPPPPQSALPTLPTTCVPECPLYAHPATITPPPISDVRLTARSWLGPGVSGVGLASRPVPATFAEEADDAGGALVLHAIDSLAQTEAAAADRSVRMPDLVLGSHPASKSVVAIKMLDRLRTDGEWLSARLKSAAGAPTCLRGFGGKAASAPSASAAMISTVDEIIESLEQLLEADATAQKQWVPWLLQTASEGGAAATEEQLRARALARASGAEPGASLELLAELLMSPRGASELGVINPLLSEEEADELLSHTAGVLLIVSRSAHTSRALVTSRKLRDEMARGAPPSERAVLADQLAALLATRRTHCKRDDGDDGPTFDPRLLVFEFSTGFVLRPQQVSLVGRLVAAARGGKSVCHQMLMGEGKTTVISPLLALLLGEDALVMQIVPAQLLNFALSVLRGCFGCGAMRKAVWTFAFDRRTPVTAELLEKARAAVAERAVMLSTPTAVKAFMLKLVELLHLLDSGQYPRNRTGVARRMRAMMRMRRRSSVSAARAGMLDKPALHAQAAWAVALLGVWRGAVAVIDEVDMVFHPLRSELNWPLGDRHPLDFEPSRWELPMRLLDAVLAVDPSATQTLVSEPGGVTSLNGAKLISREVELLDALRSAVQRGVASKQLQRVPHLVVLDIDFYHSELRPHLTAWLLVWMRRRGLRDVADAPIEKCLAKGGADASILDVAALPDEFVKMINLGEIRRENCRDVPRGSRAAPLSRAGAA